MKKLYVALLSSSLILASCGSEQKKEEKKGKKEEKKEVTKTCVYKVDENSIKVNFTGYKFAEPNKKGVNGRFEKIAISNNQMSEDPAMTAKGITFEIQISDLYTGDPSRDKKIKENFFGTMMGTTSISGTVKAVEGDQLTIEMKMNEIAFEFPATQVIQGDNITLNAEINTDNWDGQDAIAALNKVCEANHKIDGGESVLWPDVTIKIEGKLTKECK